MLHHLIYISYNFKSNFHSYLYSRSLNWLDIHKNQIEEIGNYFDREDELNIHTMDISFNKLKTVTAKMIPNQVQTISLNDNLITRIDPNTFSGKDHLIRVDLYANQIVKLESSSIRLPPRETRHKKSRPMFYFGGNPFLCDCNLEWLQTINNEENFSLYPVVNDLESIYCRLMFSKEDAFVPLVEVSSISSVLNISKDRDFISVKLPHIRHLDPFPRLSATLCFSPHSSENILEVIIL